MSVESTDERAERVEGWFSTPVILAAVASVPAMFLTTLEGAPASVGSAVNAVTVVVFVAETLVLLALTGDRRAWVRRHRFTILVTLATIPAVLFALGPVQILRLVRLVRMVGALRILRVRRILRAGRVLRARAGLDGWAWRTVSLLLTVAAAVFVGFVLTDPTSTTRQAVDAAVGRFGFLLTVPAGAILAGSTYVLARRRRGADPTGARRGSTDPAGSEAMVSIRRSGGWRPPVRSAEPRRPGRR